MRLYVLMFHQDDPKKCTAAKMVRLGLARPTRRIGAKSLVLDPFADGVLLPRDRKRINSVVGIDCSWNLAARSFSKGFGGLRRRLPPLLAGNPVNYSKVGRLSTVEAISASLIILGFRPRARELLAKFNWGHTFLDLNGNLLEEYSGIDAEGDVEGILRDFGLA